MTVAVIVGCITEAGLVRQNVPRPGLLADISDCMLELLRLAGAVLAGFSIGPGDVTRCLGTGPRRCRTGCCGLRRQRGRPGDAAAGSGGAHG